MNFVEIGGYVGDKIKNIFNKKTVYYIESITFIISIIVVVLANVFGPIWIRMIPLLFLLGIIGKVVFNRPVITTIFGGIVSLCVVYISGVTELLQNVIISAIFMTYIAFGEVFGSKIKIVYGHWISKKSKKNKEYIISILFCVVIVLICTLFHNYTDSNIFMYASCKNRLDEYLNKNYRGQHFNIVYSKYNFSNESNFVFDIQDKNTDDNYRFIVYVDKNLEIYDGIKENNISKDGYKMKQSIENIIGKDFVDIEIGVNKLSEGYELCLLKTVDTIEDTKVLEFSKSVSQIIDLIIDSKQINDIEYITISLLDSREKTNNRISSIYMTNYIKNKEEGIQKGYNYIMKSLEIEYID